MEEAFVIIGSATLIIAIVAVPFLFFCNLMMNTWDGTDKTKQYRKD